MSRRRPSKKDRIDLKHKELTLSLHTGKAEIRVYDNGEVTSTSSGWGDEGIAQAMTNSYAGYLEGKNVAAREKTKANARARSGNLNKKTRFLIWAIDATFEDFPKWWRERGGRSVSWRQQQVIARLAANERLIKNLPESITGLDVELSGDNLLIDGKSVTVNQIKSVIPHLVKDS